MAQVENKESLGFPSHDIGPADLKPLMDLPGVVIEVDAITAWAIASTIQLALRYPNYSPELRAIITPVARQIYRTICVTPELAEIARRGWHSEFDVQ